MHISQLTLRNFRNFDNATFQFKKGVNTLIGENGSGKTNVFHALRLLLDSNLSRNALNLQEKDFNRTLGKDWKGHWIVISLEFAELSADEAMQCLAVHNFAFPDEEDEDRAGKGNYNFFYRPNYRLRKELYDISINEELSPEDKKTQVDQIVASITVEDYEQVLTCRAQNLNFTDDTFYSKHVGDYDGLVLPNPDEECLDELGVPAPRNLQIYNDISCTFAEALRNVVSDLRGNRRNPLMTLLRDKEGGIPEATKATLRQSIQNLNRDIGGLTPITDISTDIKGKIRDTVGETYAPNISIEANLPEEIGSLFQSLTLKVGDPDDSGFIGNIEDLSLGGANLVYLSLKLLEYNLELQTDKAAYFLFIEEPEAHIHTHIQKTLFQNVHDANTQVIYSTHSTHISDASRISRMNILSKETNRALVFHPSNGLDEPDFMRLERYLDAIRSTLLFARSAMLIEGDAELLFIPSLIKEVLGVSLDELGISLVSVGSTGFENIAKIFHQDRVRKRCAIITDHDQSILQLSADPQNDTKAEEKCRASQVSGEARFQALEAFTAGNDWLQAFYAPHTFEVDLVPGAKETHLNSLMDRLYVQQAAKDRSKTALQDDDVAIYGSEILRLAKDNKKGWFAILFAETLTYTFDIPEYILDALVYALGSPKDTIIFSMIRYRLGKISSDATHANQQDCSGLISDHRADPSVDLRAEYIRILPEDTLTRLIEKFSDTQQP